MALRGAHLPSSQCTGFPNKVAIPCPISPQFLHCYCYFIPGKLQTFVKFLKFLMPFSSNCIWLNFLGTNLTLKAHGRSQHIFFFFHEHHHLVLFLLKKKKTNVFLFGCAVSLLLGVLLSRRGGRGLPPSCGAQALGTGASVAAAPGLSICDTRA